MQVTDDKRKHPRMSLHIPVTYRSRDLTLDAYAVNISQTGLLISCIALDDVGKDAEVLLTLPDNSGTLTLKGRVVWNGKISHRTVMGVLFMNNSREKLLALANFLIRRFCSPHLLASINPTKK